MRGSSRASLKALADQDKTLAASKQKIKQLEKENAVLKNENRLIQVRLTFSMSQRSISSVSSRIWT